MVMFNYMGISINVYIGMRYERWFVSLNAYAVIHSDDIDFLLLFFVFRFQP